MADHRMRRWVLVGRELARVTKERDFFARSGRGEFLGGAQTGTGESPTLPRAEARADIFRYIECRAADVFVPERVLVGFSP